MRAVKSVAVQTYTNWELRIVSDGCEITERLYNEMCDMGLNQTMHIRLIPIDKQPLFSGNVRQAGLEHATGNLISYLDSDDQWGVNHLEYLHKHFHQYDWYIFNDHLITGKTIAGNDVFHERNCKIKFGQCGTSNIVHKRIFSGGYQPTWQGLDGRGHDFEFIKRLRANGPDFGLIPEAQYYVCHYSNLIDN